MVLVRKNAGKVSKKEVELRFALVITFLFLYNDYRSAKNILFFGGQLLGSVT